MLYFFSELCQILGFFLVAKTPIFELLPAIFFNMSFKIFFIVLFSLVEKILLLQ